MSFDDLTNDNILLYAAKAYDKPNCIMRDQLVLNHLVVICNVFGPEVATRILFFKMSKDDYSALKTYLLFLSCMPEKVRGIKGHDIISSEIPVDMTIADILRTK